MNRFPSAREAKGFLVSRIVEEAQRENVPLSDVERKMLYFSESAWTLPDIMDVSDEFDRECDSNEYERKMASLIRNARKHDLSASGDWASLWSDAISTLAKEDHYILVMVGQAGVRVPKIGPPPRPPGDRFKLLATGLTITGLFVFGIFLSLKYGIDWGRLVWPIGAGVLVAYGLGLIFVGSQRLHRLFGKVIGWFLGFGQPDA